jgi:hypothetical protein
MSREEAGPRVAVEFSVAETDGLEEAPETLGVMIHSWLDTLEHLGSSLRDHRHPLPCSAQG